MKIAHIASDDGPGGANMAGVRLHLSLLRAGHQSEFFVITKRSDAEGVKEIKFGSRLLDRIKRYPWRKRQRRLDRVCVDSGAELLTLPEGPFASAILAAIPSDSDIVHLHWIRGVAEYAALLPDLCERFKVVWTLHDLNPVLGVTHFPETSFPEQVVNVHNNENFHSVSNKALNLKKAVYEQIESDRLAFACPCEWAGELVVGSGLLSKFYSAYVAYGIDTRIFRKYDSVTCRTLYSIPDDAFVIAVSATGLGNDRKGFSVLTKMSSNQFPPNSVLLLLGHVEQSWRDLLPIRSVSTGFIPYGPKVAVSLSAADVALVLSTYETGPATAMEALSAEIGLISTRVGDVERMVSGIYVEIIDSTVPENLEIVLHRFFEMKSAGEVTGKLAREKMCRDYSTEAERKRYEDFYNSFLSI